MVLATLLLICSIPQMDDTAKVVNDLPAVSSDSATKDSTLVAAALPSAPARKVKAETFVIAGLLVECFVNVREATRRKQNAALSRANASGRNR